ncbi:MAG TPA: hypothetical protein VGT44_03355 [Ktedonobacteraceae bacterium]|nr:hypothetical protein [Ktedonobacteraceae bacterium]
MIATDPLSLVFFACFLVGLLFFVVTALLGNLGHGATHTSATHQIQAAVGHAAAHGGFHAGQAGHVGSQASHATSHAGTQNGQGRHAVSQHGGALSFLNPTSVMLFLLGFGFFGYLFHNFVSFETPILTLIVAALGGIVVAALLLLAITRLFGNSEGATVQDVSDRTGLLGKVSLTIQENGIGEILYVSPGGMRKSVPARSIDGRRLEREQEVVVVNYSDGVAEVDTWDHFIHEEGSYPEVTGKTATDSLEQLRTLLDEASKPDSQQLVIRNDVQME